MGSPDLRLPGRAQVVRCRAGMSTCRPRGRPKSRRDTLAPGVSALPRIKIGMSAGGSLQPGCESRDTWAVRFSSSGRAPPADLLLCLRIAGNIRSNCLSWFSGHLFVQPLGFCFQKGRDFFVLGLDCGLGLGCRRLDLFLRCRRNFHIFSTGETRRPARSSRLSGWGRTCGRGSGRMRR